MNESFLQSANFIQSAYLVAAVMFILGLRNLSSPKTAVSGNIQAAIGMFIAIVATLLDANVVTYGVIIGGIVVFGTWRSSRASHRNDFDAPDGCTAKRLRWRGFCTRGFR